MSLSLFADVTANENILWMVCAAMIAAIGKMWLEVRKLDKEHSDCEIRYVDLKSKYDGLRREFDAFKIQHYSQGLDDEGAFFTVNQDGLVVLWPPTISKLVGYTEEEMLGESFFKLIPERFHQLHHEQLSAIVSGHKSMSRHFVDVSFVTTRAGMELPITTEVRSYRLYEPTTEGHEWYFRVTLEQRVKKPDSWVPGKT